MADRISLSNDWFKRGVQLLDEYDHRQEQRTLFESYIYLWIALTVAAKEYCACDGKIFDNDSGQKATDKDEILHWAMECKQAAVLSMLKNNKEIILELCERTGSDTDEPIMDTTSQEIVNYYNQFIKYWTGEARYCKSEEIVKTFVLILNRVRNNLFHGAKSFRVESDIEILELTTPLLKDLTKICIDTL
jgi:hypothetical protein